MSKKGQDNQRGIGFQNKVALLYMLDNYKYSNFLKIKLEGSQFEDFTLFFSDLKKTSSFFREFEVKNLSKALTLTDIRNIIKKELEKGAGRYSDKDSFYIVAPSFSEKCKTHISALKESYCFYSYKEINSAKKMYNMMYDKNPILDWNEEEILFIKHKTEIVALSEKNTDQWIQERFYREQGFFYTKDNAQNIISQFFKKISELSSQGEELTKQKITKIITEFCENETNKSESYDLKKDLGTVVQDIKIKLQTEDDFAKLNDNRYITPISKRERVIFCIVNKLKKTEFQFKKIKWFFDKILIKERYMLHSLNLLKKYAEKESLDLEDKDNILEFIFKLYNYEQNSSSFYKKNFNTFYKDDIFTILLKLSKTNISDDFKKKVYLFLNKVLPDWQKVHREQFYHDIYTDIPETIKNVFDYTKEGIELVFKTYDFTSTRDYQGDIYRNYIEEFINKDFKINFPLVVKHLVEQFTVLYKKEYRYKEYAGYELAGGGYSGFSGQYNLQSFNWESLLSYCIIQFYSKTKDWEFLKPVIYAPWDKENPVFVKRSFIPFLLQQLNGSSEENPKKNKFYKALETILEIKKGFPTTEDIVINELKKYSETLDVKQNSLEFDDFVNEAFGTKESLRAENVNKNNVGIPDVYLRFIIRKILYKYSETGISYNILLIQLIVQFIANGNLQFKEDLKKILLDKKFKSFHVYELALRIIEKKIKNQYIKEFFIEIKDKLDISQNKPLLYTDVAVISQKPSIEKLFNSSLKKDLDNLAGIVEDAFSKNNLIFIKKFLKLIEDNLVEFYKRAKISDYLMYVIAQIPPKVAAENILNNEELAEEIIDMCVNDTDLCGENKTLHEQVAIKGEESLTITTMRAHLCYSINSYVAYYCQKQDEVSLKKLAKAFSWIKILMDLDGFLADRIPGFPQPNYYLRHFALIPLTTLSYYRTRANLNKYKTGLGDEVKSFSFAVLKQTEKEIENNNYKPNRLLNHIGMLFDVIRDLTEEEAKKALCFIRKFNVSGFSYLFIYYAVFREKEALFAKMGFKSDWFKKELQDICKSRSDELKSPISFDIYKNIENKNKKSQKPEPDFDFFEKVKDYWALLFENINKNTWYSLMRTLDFVLDRNTSYYSFYKKYFFKLTEQILASIEESEEYGFLHWDETLQAVSKHAPDDLTKILFLFLEKGDCISGHIPFGDEVKNDLIPKIKQQKNKISQKNIKKAEVKLKEYNIYL